MRNRHRIARSAAAALAALLSVSLLAACGGDDSDAQLAAGATFNEADVRFAQGMLPHHVQAVEMAGLAKSRAASPAVKKLAAKILAGQQPEVVQLRALLAQWGHPLDTSMESMSRLESMRGMPGMETMEGMANLENTMAGMTSSAEVTKLRKAKGRQFDRLFLHMMLEHHRSAVAQAQTELTQGQDQEATALAEAIETTQNSEIARIEELQDA